MKKLLLSLPMALLATGCLDALSFDPELLCSESGECTGCTSTLYDNGTYDGLNAYWPGAFWDVDGVVDDFTLEQSEFCALEFDVGVDALDPAFETLRVRIYALDAGGLAVLGDFNAATPVLDQTLRVSEGSLEILDLEDTVFSLDVYRLRAFVGLSSLPSGGDYAIHISFPEFSSGDPGLFWLTAAQGGSNECSHQWGMRTPTPANNCIGGSPDAQRLAFRVYTFGRR